MNNYYIAGLDESYPETFFRLNQIFEENVFEILERDMEKGILTVPYLMNDALESFLIFENWKMTGTFQPEIKAEMEVSLGKDGAQYVLAVRQGNENAFTICFSDLRLDNHTYQYHEMGHFWVVGQEYLRQIVYRLAIMRDKYYYFEDLFCNEQEEWLLPLNNFGPLQYYYCVSWVKKEFYGSDQQAIERFMTLAREVQDYKLCKELEKLKERQNRRREKKIAKMLNQEEHLPIIRLLNEKIADASKVYARRSFGTREDKILTKCRDYITENYGSQIKKNGIEQLEEHPFSVWNGPFCCHFYLIVYRRVKTRIVQRILAVSLKDNPQKTEEEIVEKFCRQVEKKFSDIR